MYPDRAVDTFQITSAQIPTEQIPSGQWTNMKRILVRFRGKSLIKHGPKWAVDTSQAGSEQIPGGQGTDLKRIMVRFKVGSPRVDSKDTSKVDRGQMNGQIQYGRWKEPECEDETELELKTTALPTLSSMPGTHALNVRVCN